MKTIRDIAWSAPGGVNQGRVRPQGSQVTKGSGFSTLGFDLAKRNKDIWEQGIRKITCELKQLEKKGTKE